MPGGDEFWNQLVNLFRTNSILQYPPLFLKVLLLLLRIYRESFMGECKKDDAFAILDTFYDYGGNFIDTYVLTKS